VVGEKGVLIKGKSKAAELFAVQSLSQLIASKDGKTYVREGWSVDWPSFPLRGTKGARNFYVKYKPSFIYGGYTPGWAQKAYISQFMVYGSGGGKLDASDEHAAGLAEKWKEQSDKGVRRFCVKFDDVGKGVLNDASAAKFNNDFGAGLASFVTALDRELKKLNPENKVYILPPAYWNEEIEKHPEWRAAIQSIIDGKAKLPEDAGLVYCGVNVLTRNLTVASVREYTDWWHTKVTKPVIYQNMPRNKEGQWEWLLGTGDVGPLVHFDKDLPTVLDGFAVENCSDTAMMTCYDYMWNSEDYDPERSFRLACRESAGREAATALYDFYEPIVRWRGDLEYGRIVPKQYLMSRDEVFAAYKTALDRQKKAFEDLNAKLGGKTPRRESGVIAALNRRLDLAERAKAIVCRDLDVPKGTPAVDGKLDDAAWKNADWQSMYGVRKAHEYWVMSQGKGASKVPADLAEALIDKGGPEFAVCYDADNLYVAFKAPKAVVEAPAMVKDWDKHAPHLGAEIPYDQTIFDLPDWQDKFSAPWRATVMIDPETKTHFAPDAFLITADGKTTAQGKFYNDWKDMLCKLVEPAQFQVTMSSNGEWTAEFAIPWKTLKVEPKAGARYRFQALAGRNDWHENKRQHAWDPTLRLWSRGFIQGRRLDPGSNWQFFNYQKGDANDFGWITLK